MEEGAVHYLLDRETQQRAKVLSNMVKQKRKEKAGKWDVPLPKGLNYFSFKNFVFQFNFFSFYLIGAYFPVINGGGLKQL